MSTPNSAPSAPPPRWQPAPDKLAGRESLCAGLAGHFLGAAWTVLGASLVGWPPVAWLGLPFAAFALFFALAWRETHKQIEVLSSGLNETPREDHPPLIGVDIDEHGEPRSTPGCGVADDVDADGNAAGLPCAGIGSNDNEVK